MGWDTLIPTVIFVSLSGVLAPGPLFFATVMHGLNGGARSGFLIALGHMLFELPLVLAIASGVFMVLNFGLTKIVIGTIGSIAMIAFGSIQVLDSMRSKPNGINRYVKLKVPASAILVGLLFTSLNPFFIVWWASVGISMVMEAMVLASFTGALIMYFSHVWLDYAWLTFVAHISGRASSLLSERWMRILMVALGLTLIGLGLNLFISIMLS